MPKARMIAEPAEVGSRNFAEVDDDLSKLALSTMRISETREITSADATFQLPKQLHAGLYSNTLQDTVMGASAGSSKNTDISENQNQGIPGFPDFPDSWSGEEGWAVWRRVDSKPSQKAQRRQTAEKIQEAHQSMVFRRFKRQSVNVAGLNVRRAPRKSGCKPPNKTKAHKMDRRRKLVQQLKHRREMVGLRTSLKALNCK